MVNVTNILPQLKIKLYIKKQSKTPAGAGKWGLKHLLSKVIRMTETVLSNGLWETISKKAPSGLTDSSGKLVRAVDLPLRNTQRCTKYLGLPPTSESHPVSPGCTVQKKNGASERSGEQSSGDPGVGERVGAWGRGGDKRAKGGPLLVLNTGGCGL